MALVCGYCGKDWVQPCWDATEASNCGNLDRRAMATTRKAISEVEAQITQRDGERAERDLLARLKAKYE